MAAIFLNGFSATLTANLTPTMVYLPVASATNELFCSRVGNGHTYLVLNNGSDVEVARAECSGGKILLTRSASPITMVSGSCAEFEVTAELLTDFNTGLLDGVLPTCEVNPDNPDKVDVVIGECQLTLNTKECDEVSWVANGKKYTFLDGCVEEEALTNCLVVPGTYKNATVHVGPDGCITFEEGSNIVYSQNPCCNCSDAAT